MTRGGFASRSKRERFDLLFDRPAKANGQEPSLWLAEVLSELPYAQTADDYDRLLPWNIHPKDLAINPKP